MRLMVLGAGGMLARDVIRSAEAAGHEVVAAGREDADVTDAAAMREVVAAAAPEAVINCAASTDVDGAETDEEGARRVNGEGAGHAAAAAEGAGASVVYISSEYVFDGRKGEPYMESDPVAPLSAYARTKLAGERATAAANPRHQIVRTQWLFGVGGQNFVETMLRLGAERDEVTVVDDQVGCPTYTGHLAAGLVQLLENDRTGVMHLAAGGQCSWFEFAQAIFERAGVDCRVQRGTTAELARPAPRPAHAVLRTEHRDVPTLPTWDVGLDRYLTTREVARA